MIKVGEDNRPSAIDSTEVIEGKFSFTDSIVVRDDTAPIGVIGGKEIIQGVYKNPSSDFFEMTCRDTFKGTRVLVFKRIILCTFRSEDSSMQVIFRI